MPINKAKPYQRVAAAGTFDRLHKGHEKFLQKAFSIGKTVIIGLTTDNMAKVKPLGKLILSYELRLKELKNYLKKHNLLNSAKITPIDDIYGPADTDPHLEAIVVSRQTKFNADRINKRRKKNKLQPLSIITTPFVNNIQHKPIASQRIRAGLEDRQGRVFTARSLFLYSRTITDRERRLLKQPLGEFFPGRNDDLLLSAKAVTSYIPRNAPLVITVGDVATISLSQLKFRINLAIVDLHVGRKRIYQHVGQLGLSRIKKEVAANPRGNVSKQLFFAVEKIMGVFCQYLRQDKDLSKHTHLIQVIGEEDLAVLPVVLLAPLSSVVIYGQPPLAFQGAPLEGKEGLVVVEATEEKKDQIRKLLQSLPKLTLDKGKVLF